MLLGLQNGSTKVHFHTVDADIAHTKAPSKESSHAFENMFYTYAQRRKTVTYL
jgi:hypothetical protein